MAPKGEETGGSNHPRESLPVKRVPTSQRRQSPFVAFCVQSRSFMRDTEHVSDAALSR